MGEYATYNGHNVKIGTCEDLLYLRADQRHLIVPESGLVLDVYRFRFPFPDEDAVAPGDFDNPFRGVSLYGVDVPEEIEHGRVQFVAGVGYNVMLACPLSEDGRNSGLAFHANGFAGPVKIVQQAFRDGVLVTVCECGACGSKYRLPALADAEPLIVACRSEADRFERDGDISRATWWHAIADRITAGYAIGS
jgi:hypothetical protein